MKRIDEMTITINPETVEIIHKGCVGKAKNSGCVQAAMLQAVANWTKDWDEMPARRAR